MGAFKQNNALSDIGDHCTENRFHTAFFLVTYRVNHENFVSY